MAKSKKYALVLTDHYIGNAKQALALAGLMDWRYVKLDIKYTKYAMLPNILQFGYLNVTQETVSELEQLFQVHGIPQVVIAAGRRPAQFALQIKSKHKSVKLIQIMKPDLMFWRFDHIILPLHDKNWWTARHKNVTFITGALVDFQPSITLRPNPEITGLLLGDVSIDDLWDRLILQLKTANKTLLISTSRRTSTSVKDFLRAALSKEKDLNIFLKEYGASEGLSFNNSTKLQKYSNMNDAVFYKEILESASTIIATFDSISMCSEAMKACKALYIYMPQKLVKTYPKHAKFASAAIEAGHAKLFTGDLTQYIPKPIEYEELLKAKLKYIME